jgi:hypothetical protein
MVFWARRVPFINISPKKGNRILFINFDLEWYEKRRRYVTGKAIYFPTIFTKEKDPPGVRTHGRLY